MKPIKAWAVALEDDYFIPDFNAKSLMKDVMQIHSKRKSAQEVATMCGKGWIVLPVLISKR